MTQENPLLELRDIHLPHAPSGSSAQMFAPEPFIVLAVLVAVAAGYSRWRQGQWRGDARTRLHELEASASCLRDKAATDEDGWQQLVALAAEVARRTQTTPLPDCVFVPPTQAGQDERMAVFAFLKQTLETGR